MAKVISRHFETVQEFLDYLNTSPQKPGWSTETSGRTVPEYFAKSRDLEHACELASKGWPEGLERITKKLNIMLGTGRSRYRLNDVAGDFPNIGRFLAGMPDSMTRRVIAEGIRRPIIELVLNASFNGGTDTSAIENYGAAIAGVIDEMEEAGFSVGLRVAASTRSYDKGRSHAACFIALKKPGEIMELDRLVFFTAHPSFLRRLGFSFFETIYLPSELTGHGSTSKLSDLNSDVSEDAICFDSDGQKLNSSCRNIEGAFAHIKDIVRSKRPDLFPDASEAA